MLTADSKLIGQKFILVDGMYEENAYKDQFGIYHRGFVVYRHFIVTITEVKPTKGNYSGEEKYTAWKAVTEDGRVFTNCWDTYPEDSYRGQDSFWDLVMEDDNRVWLPRDIVELLNGTKAIVTPGGHPFRPINVCYCDKHEVFYYDDSFNHSNSGCWKCRYQM